MDNGRTYGCMFELTLSFSLGSLLICAYCPQRGMMYNGDIGETYDTM